MSKKQSKKMIGKITEELLKVHDFVGADEEFSLGTLPTKSGVKIHASAPTDSSLWDFLNEFCKDYKTVERTLVNITSQGKEAIYHLTTAEK